MSYDPAFLPDFLLASDPTPEELAAIRAGRQAARDAAAALRRAAFVTGARARAAASLRDRRWAWARRDLMDEAEALLAREDLSEAAAARLAALSASADATVQRAAVAARVPVAFELGLARDPAVRAAAAEGVALLTSLDGDVASVRNAAGWGKAAAVVGHVLAAAGDLDEAQASHALRILRRHRRQLPAPLAARLFEGASL